MKKRYSISLLSVIMTLMFSTLAYAATGPAYPEVPVTERTSNLAANQNFVDWSSKRANDTGQGKMYYYNTYGQVLANIKLAGGAITTNENGMAIWNCKLIDGVNFRVFDVPMPTSDYGWKQDTCMPINNNGISNWYYGNNGVPSYTSKWEWLPDQDNVFSTKKAYCFNEYGYLYVNTITPDGFIVNERGQMITEDGTLVEHEVDALTHDAMHSSFIGAPIGFMRQKYFTTCIWPECGGKCFTGANEKEFTDRPSQYTEEENRRKIGEVRDSQ